jgi:hypothetical protein
VAKNPGVTRRAKAPSKRTARQASAGEAVSLGPVAQGLLPVAVVAVVLVLGFFLWKHRPHMDMVSGAPVAASHPIWGPEVKLNVVSQFQAPGPVQAIRADAQGHVYLLTHDKITAYADGRVIGSQDLKINADFLNMAFDGTDFYVTFNSNQVLKVNKGLKGVQKLEITGASNLLGVGAGPNGLYYVGDLQNHAIYAINAQGKVKHVLNNVAGLNCPVDVQVQANGDLICHDHLALQVFRLSPAGAVLASWPVPWTSHQEGWERLCVLDGKIYIDGYNDHRLFVQDLQGNNLAQCKALANGSPLDQPNMVGAGLDGFLYVQNHDVIYKLKPWSEPPPAAGK